MSPPVKRILSLVAALGLIALLIWAFTAGRKEQAAERLREAPVASPSRVQRAGRVVGIVLDSATAQRIDIVTAPLGAAARDGTISLTGELAEDPSQVTSVQAPLAGRLVAAVGAPWPTVGQRVAAGRALGQVSDARPMTAPRGGTVTAVGARPGELVQPGQLLLTIVDFDRLLARVLWRPDAPSTPPATIEVRPMDDGQRRGLVNADAASGAASGAGAVAVPRARARLVGPGMTVDTLTRAPLFLYRVERAWPGARPGLPIVATLPDSRSIASGVLVPADAAVQWNALTWIYVQRGRGPYVRVRLDTSTPVADGWLVRARPAGEGADPSADLAIGDLVVVRGAQQLLSEEFRSTTATMGEGGR